MNTKIEELAQQCMQYKLYRNALISEFDHKKFAEMIVKETILQMCIQMLEHGDDQSNNPAFYKAIEGTEKYLGVKQ